MVNSWPVVKYSSSTHYKYTLDVFADSYMYSLSVVQRLNLYFFFHMKLQNFEFKNYLNHYLKRSDHFHGTLKFFHTVSVSSSDSLVIIQVKISKNTHWYIYCTLKYKSNILIKKKNCRQFICNNLCICPRYLHKKVWTNPLSGCFSTLSQFHHLILSL
jgi:hypothetical protein